MSITESNSIEEFLCKEFPTARPGFVKILLQALKIHAAKNNDYNGSEVLFPPTAEDFYHDIKRKFGRLYNIFSKKTEVMVDEKLEDTVLDLGNYSFLMAEQLSKLPKTSQMGEEPV